MRLDWKGLPQTNILYSFYSPFINYGRKKFIPLIPGFSMYVRLRPIITAAKKITVVNYDRTMFITLALGFLQFPPIILKLIVP
jgi:hypothetical protein